MPPPKPALAADSGIAHNNSHDSQKRHSEQIDGLIALDASQGLLRELQARIDEQRATALHPTDNLRTIMVMLDSKLTSLAESLAHWQALLDRELPEDHPDTLLPIEKIGAMLAAIAHLRERVAESAGETPEAGGL